MWKERPGASVQLCGRHMGDRKRGWDRKTNDGSLSKAELCEGPGKERSKRKSCGLYIKGTSQGWVLYGLGVTAEIGKRKPDQNGLDHEIPPQTSTLSSRAENSQLGGLYSSITPPGIRSFSVFLISEFISSCCKLTSAETSFTQDSTR